ncbi:MAG: GIY-YIG nuclease family protein [Oscillospiraceae bacterium]|nr:GIY-YIG nuclease family protein [Oscillospiraceae bacterium]
MSDEKWVLYILECGDHTLYTGITNDLEKRLEAHRAGTGAKYTRGRGPLTLCYTEPCEDRGQASRREWEVKHMTRAEKMLLFRTDTARRG